MAWKSIEWLVICNKSLLKQLPGLYATGEIFPHEMWIKGISTSGTPVRIYASPNWVWPLRNRLKCTENCLCWLPVREQTTVGSPFPLPASCACVVGRRWLWVESMAVAMQTDDFPYLPSGPAESMSCLFNSLTCVLEENGAVALCKSPPCYSLKYRRCCYLRKANVSRYLSISASSC